MLITGAVMKKCRMQMRYFDLVLSKSIVDQEWFDERLKCTSPERLSELLKELR